MSRWDLIDSSRECGWHRNAIQPYCAENRIPGPIISAGKQNSSRPHLALTPMTEGDQSQSEICQSFWAFAHGVVFVCLLFCFVSFFHLELSSRASVLPTLSSPLSSILLTALYPTGHSAQAPFLQDSRLEIPGLYFHMPATSVIIRIQMCCTKGRRNPRVRQWVNGYTKRGIHMQWTVIQP